MTTIYAFMDMVGPWGSAYMSQLSTILRLPRYHNRLIVHQRGPCPCLLPGSRRHFLGASLFCRILVLEHLLCYFFGADEVPVWLVDVSTQFPFQERVQDARRSSFGARAKVGETRLACQAAMMGEESEGASLHIGPEKRHMRRLAVVVRMHIIKTVRRERIRKTLHPVARTNECPALHVSNDALLRAGKSRNITRH